MKYELNIDQIKSDIKKLDEKKRNLQAEYPGKFADIAKKHGITTQYVFAIRKGMRTKKD